MPDNMKSERIRIGLRLRSSRERAHITVEEAAAALEVQPLAIERWERGAALPTLLELRRILAHYGVMACTILFEVNPWELPQDEAAELARAAKNFSPGLKARVDVLLAMMARGREPQWRGQTDRA